MSAVFVTGTDTNAGKTAFSCALVGRLRSSGLTVRALKPVESGCSLEADGLRGPDASLLLEASGHEGPNCLYRYAQPLAPGVAADLEGNRVDLAKVVAWTQTMLQGADFGLVEGAGGWEVPLSGAASISTFAQALGLPVLVVGRAGLGTINHTVLSLRAISSDGCAVAGFALSETTAIDPLRTDSNAAEIQRLTALHGVRAPYWGVLRHEPVAADARLELTDVAQRWLPHH